MVRHDQYHCVMPCNSMAIFLECPARRPVHEILSICTKHRPCSLFYLDTALYRGGNLSHSCHPYRVSYGALYSHDKKGEGREGQVA